MKTTALITLPKETVVKSTLFPAKRKKNLNMAELNECAAMVEKLWEMYHLQLKRTQEMMMICETQQAELEQSRLQPSMQVIQGNADKPRKEREIRLQPISFDEMERLGKAMQDILEITRNTYAFALVKMLYTLKQQKGAATPHQLFAAAEISEVSGYRYASHLSNVNLIIYNPTNRTGYYEITALGKIFLKGEIKGRTDLQKIREELGYVFEDSGYVLNERRKELRAIHEKNRRKEE